MSHDELRISRYTSEKSNRPEVYTGAWLDAVELLKTHQFTICTAENCAGKDCPHKRGAAFNFAELRPGTTRASQNVLWVHAAVFDIDKITREQLLALVEALKAAGCACVLSSTHSHRPHAIKLRLAFALSRPATASEWPSVWHSINGRFALGADSSAQDPARLYFGPTCPTGVKPIAWSQVGAPLDVDLCLLDAPPPTARKAPLSGADWLQHLAHLGEGNRDNGLTQLAGLLIRVLPPALAEELIHLVNDARCKPPLDPAQVDKIVGSVARREAQRLQGVR